LRVVVPIERYLLLFTDLLDLLVSLLSSFENFLASRWFFLCDELLDQLKDFVLAQGD